MLQPPSNSARNLHGNSAASAGLGAAPLPGRGANRGRPPPARPRPPRSGGTCPGAGGPWGDAGAPRRPGAQGWRSQRLRAGPSRWSGAGSGSATGEAPAPPKGRGPAAVARPGWTNAAHGAGEQTPKGQEPELVIPAEKARASSGRARNTGWTTAVARSLRVRAGRLRGRRASSWALPRLPTAPAELGGVLGRDGRRFCRATVARTPHRPQRLCHNRVRPPEDAGIGRAEGEQALPLGCWLESRLRQRIAGSGGDSHPGKSTPSPGSRGYGAAGEQAAWEGQEAAASSKSHLGLLAALTWRFLLLLGLVSGQRKQFLAWRILAGVWNIQTQLQPLRFTLL